MKKEINLQATFTDSGFILKVMKIPAIYTFAYTNLVFFMLALFVVVKYLKAGEKNKNILILCLSIHPVIFYIGWTSAEVFLYSCMIVAMVCWFNQWYKRAAVAISIAGMLNPTILSVGIIMIFEYLTGKIKTRNKDIKFIQFIKYNMKDLLCYGSCYLLALIPMVYYYYNTGYINLTASYNQYVNGNESVLKRFCSYIFDLNYGMLPYFTAVVMVAAIMLIISLICKNWHCLEWIFTFLIQVGVYSVMVHINGGMAGIARYNVWSSAILIFAVCLYLENIFKNRKVYFCVRGCIYIGIFTTGMIVYNFGPYQTVEIPYLYMTPIAETVLDKFPALYNPLHSTFYSRTLHIDGGYDYHTPVVYRAKDGYVRKILASGKDVEKLLANYISVCGYDDWLKNQIQGFDETEKYISIPAKYQVVRCQKYDMESKMIFSRENYNGDIYVANGLSVPEDWGSWTEGNELRMFFRTDSNANRLQGEIFCNVYNDNQDIVIYANDKKIFEERNFKGGSIQFDFENPGAQKPICIKVELPRAISPSEFGFKDERVLGLGLTSIIFSECEGSIERELNGKGKL